MLARLPVFAAAVGGEPQHHTAERPAGDAGRDRFGVAVAVGADRRFPGMTEAARIRASGETIGAFAGDADLRTGRLHAACVEQGGDEGALALRRPAVAAGADGDWFEAQDVVPNRHRQLRT